MTTRASLSLLAPAPHPAKARDRQRSPRAVATTSSERGRHYRARMNRRAASLEAAVFDLRRLVAQLDARRSIYDAWQLQRRHDAHGSRAKLVHKYFTVFNESMAAQPPPAAATFLAHESAVAEEIQTRHNVQALFLEHIMEPDVLAGDLVGPLAILDQWRRYASSHLGFSATILGLSTSGCEEDPVVTLHAQAHGKITGATFYTLFPGVIKAGNDALVQKLLNKEVQYEIRNRYLFTPDNRIRAEIVEIDFAQGLLRAGASLREVGQLLENSTISMHCTLRTREARKTVGLDGGRRI